MRNFLEVGKVIGFHGLKGEIKVLPFTEYPERFEEIKEVFIDKKSYKIQKVRIQKGKAYLFLSGIKDRTEAEKLKDQILFISKREAQEPEEDEYFLVDLIGLKVLDRDNNEIGTLKDIMQTSGPVDNFVIKTEEKDIYVPALKEYFEIIPGEAVIADIPEDLMDL